MTTEKSPNGGELRQRNTAAATKAATNGNTKTTPEKDASATKKKSSSSSSFSILDVFRALAGIALVSTVGSYLVTHGESYTWGLKVKMPWWTDYKQVQRAMQSPLLLTNDELAAYDGSDPSKPILLALNRTIYDVSASPQTYGPGGAYSTLAAKDASRSYITTCFDPVDDLVPYLGGVEEIFVPLWLSKKPPKEELENIAKGEIVYGKDALDIIDEIHKRIGRKHIKGLRKDAYEEARQRVQDKIKMWEGMFEKKGYPVVGKVVGVDEDDPTKWRHLSFCEDAIKQRPSLGETMEAAFRKVGREDKMNLAMGRQMANMAGGKKKKSSKKKYGKKKHSDIGLGSDSNTEASSDSQGDWDHSQNEKAAAQIEDMLKGGKWYTERKRSVEDIIKHGPYGDNPEMAEKAKKILKKNKANIPDAVPDEVIPEERLNDEEVTS